MLKELRFISILVNLDRFAATISKHNNMEDTYLLSIIDVLISKIFATQPSVAS